MSLERVEVLTGEPRRRRWTREAKEEIVLETLAAGATVAEVARRHGIGRSLLYRWRRAMKVSRHTAPVTFVPVEIAGTAAGTGREIQSPPATQEQAGTSTLHEGAAETLGRMEIELGDGTRVRVGRDVDTVALRRVLAALERR